MIAMTVWDVHNDGAVWPEWQSSMVEVFSNCFGNRIEGVERQGVLCC